LVSEPVTNGLAAFCERISLAFWEPFFIDPTRHVRAGAPNKCSVNLKLNDLRTPGCTCGVIHCKTSDKGKKPVRLMPSATVGTDTAINLSKIQHRLVRRFSLKAASKMIVFHLWMH
jgi:hypothetical protein